MELTAPSLFQRGSGMEKSRAFRLFWSCDRFVAPRMAAPISGFPKTQLMATWGMLRSSSLATFSSMVPMASGLIFSPNRPSVPFYRIESTWTHTPDNVSQKKLLCLFVQIGFFICRECNFCKSLSPFFVSLFSEGYPDANCPDNVLKQGGFKSGFARIIRPGVTNKEIIHLFASIDLGKLGSGHHDGMTDFVPYL